MSDFFQLTTDELHHRCRAIAVLEAIASPEWEGRRYSWAPQWGDGEQVLEGRDGQGDCLLILFQGGNVAINLFSIDDGPGDRATMLKNCPDNFREFFFGEPVATLDSTNCWWRIGNQSWVGDTASVPQWLSTISGGPENYLAEAEDYYDESLAYTAAAAETVGNIYRFAPLTREMVLALSPNFSDWAQLADDLDEIGYPHSTQHRTQH